jgi:hypothetical protein
VKYEIIILFETVITIQAHNAKHHFKKKKKCKMTCFCLLSLVIDDHLTYRWERAHGALLVERTKLSFFNLH